MWAPQAKVPEWLDELPSPRILISVSTELQDDSAIIDTALEALADEKASLIVASGVPVCVIPWGRDQSETARRVGGKLANLPDTSFFTFVCSPSLLSKSERRLMYIYLSEAEIHCQDEGSRLFIA